MTGKVFDSLDASQRELDEFITHYNTERPHSSIGMVPPITRFVVREPRPAPPELQSPRPREDRQGPEWVSRTINVNGVVTVSGQQFSVGKSRSGRVLDVKVAAQTLEVWDGAELVKAVKRLTTGEVRKKRAESKERS